MEVIRKYENNPVLAAAQVPYPASLVFNAGVTKYQGRYVMVFRNDYGFEEETIRRGEHLPHGTNLGLAFSDDGVDWQVCETPCFEMHDDEIRRAYDPRLTVIEGRCYMCFAVDTRHGVRGGVAVTDDFESFDVLSLSAPDNRNMVLFPERIGGNYVRLERPFPVYGRGGGERFDMWLSESPDFAYWGKTRLALGVEDVPFANTKIGPGAPPVRTQKGWLTTIHAVYRDPENRLDGWEPGGWYKEYFGGLALLDPDDPSSVIGLCREPVLRAELDYEKKGFRGSVIFPGGMILEDSGEVKIYYGAADTVEALASADVGDLLALCRPV